MKYAALFSLLFLLPACANARTKPQVTPPLPPPVEALPAEALPALEEFRAAAGAARERYESEMKGIRDQASQKLQLIQDAFTKEAKLDEALAVRDAIRDIQRTTPPPEPPGPPMPAHQIGESYEVEITGNAVGPVWGSGPYTSDSNIASAAVHAGLVKIGKKARIKVKVVAGLPAYEGTKKHRVQSRDWGAWPTALELKLAK